MTRKTLAALPILALLSLFASLPVHAAQVSWTFQNAVFDDGGSLTGSFVYDLNTNDYTNINVQTSAGTTLGASSYNSNTILGSNASLLAMADSQAADLTGAHALSLFFDGGLSNAGGLVDLLIIAGPAAGTRENVCDTPDCLSATGLRGLVSGSVFGTPYPLSAVPVPAAAWLFASALAGLAGIARRRKHARVDNPGKR